ncbi:MAG TPA: hypothetical protein VNU68_35475 [Verrucomicrobiae bacterium]|nr:hypothetical protein [Verrucomicrobiae bacterium]
MGQPLGSPVQGTVRAPSQTSAKMDTSTGSGSRPGNTRYPIESSAPSNPRMLDRDPPAGWLGSGGEKARG